MPVAHLHAHRGRAAIMARANRITDPKARTALLMGRTRARR